MKYVIFACIVLFSGLCLGVELISNGGFESSFLSPWDEWASYGTSSIETSQLRSGSQSLRITGQSSGVQAYQYVTLEEGVEYTLSGWINIPDSSVYSAFLGVYDSGCGSYLFDRNFISGPTSGWVKFGPYTFTAPSCVGSWPYVQLGGYGNGGTVYWDDVTLTSEELPPEPEPGSDPYPDPNIAVTTDWYSEFVSYNTYMFR